jgi:hypothetical protein
VAHLARAYSNRCDLLERLQEALGKGRVRRVAAVRADLVQRCPALACSRGEASYCSGSVGGRAVGYLGVPSAVAGLGLRLSDVLRKTSVVSHPETGFYSVEDVFAE